MGPSSRGDVGKQHLCRAVGQDLGGLEVSQGEGGMLCGIDQNRAEWHEGCIGHILYKTIGGGLQYFLIFTPNLGEKFQFDSYFSDGLKPPTSIDDTVKLSPIYLDLLQVIVYFVPMKPPSGEISLVYLFQGS